MLKKTSGNRNKKSPAKKNPSAKTNETKKHPFPVVAIGASTGGIEAVSELLKNLPANTGMAYIIVQHLNKDHKSYLTSILSKTTKMEVQEIDEMELMKPDNVYVIPYNRGIKVTNGHIKLIPRSKDGNAVSIDILFSSLALTHKENVIGVILSGNLHDGTIGLKAIKDAGGITFAQDGSAQAHSMPQSAIASGVVDFVLSPKEIAREFIRLSKNGFLTRGAKGKQQEDTSIEDNDPHLKTILEILHKKFNVDFSRYKMSTVRRRIQNRMLQCHVKTIKEYAKLLLKKTNEVDILYKDLLINVTSFFRDKENFQYLKTTLLPKILKSKADSDQAIRIWIPACSTGEEAYTIAMLITELQDHKTKKNPIQIFATDLSDHAIHDARIGEYSQSDVKPITKERIERFFIKTDNHYRVIKEIREMCVFAPHNVLRDPPFLRLDLISCRNLLIYFDAAAQKKALAIFHFALGNGKYLMLGKSETTGTSSQLFTRTSKKLTFFSKKKNIGLLKVPELLPRFSRTVINAKNTTPTSKNNTGINSTELDSVIDSALLSNYVPACAIINKDMEILKFRGSTSLFLTHPSGNASLNILKMTRTEIAFDLRSAIHKAIKTKQPVRKSDIEMNFGSSVRLITLEVCPLKVEWEEPLFLIVFTDQRTNYNQNEKGRKNSSTEKDRRIKKQAEELNNAHAEMHSIIEARETAYEELQAANEEIVSTNEEFQSLNEELETSKEEIEATNEELISTNEELRIRNEQLTETYDFAIAIAATMHEPFLVLGKDLRIRSANKAFYKKFMVLRKETEGKLLYELGNHQWDIASLRELLENIIQKDASFNDYLITHVFPKIGKKSMLLNARRIIQKSQNEHLILLAFTDVTESIRKRRAEKKGLENIISERTTQLEESYKTLEEKNVFLEKANKELETFTFISSHDLQEPLRKIKNFSDSLLQEENKNLSGKGKHYLKRMEETVKRMQMLIEDLLAYSRVKNGAHNFEKTYLNEIAKEVIDNFSETLKEKKAEIKADGLCHAKIIRFQFRQVLQNLISNALKFSHPKRFPRIIIKCEIKSGNILKIKDLLPEVNYCHLTVSDNGIGFKRQYKDRIFEVFQRLHEFDKYKGTGIGLAICKRIIENHNGIITATGKLNKGTRIDIYIPAS